jgi:hypothetical protein
MSNNLFLKILGKEGIDVIKKTISIVLFLLLILFVFIMYRNSRTIAIKEFYTPAIINEIQADFNGGIYFGKIGDPDIFKELLITEISKAESSIDLAIYSFDFPEVLDILKEKQSQGIPVRIIVPKSKNHQHDRLFENNNFEIKIIGKDDEYFMHHKYVIIDGSTDKASILFGSTNYTEIQLKYDPGFIIQTNEKEFIEIFSIEFERLLDNKYGYKKIFDSNYNPFASLINYNNGFVEIWFTPGYKKNSIKYRKIELIEQAESSIKVLGWRFNDRDIMRALIVKMREGVDVQVLADDYYFYNEYSVVDNLRAVQADLELENGIYSDSFYNLVFDLNLIPKDVNLKDDFNSFLHQHALIVDDEILVTGTNNWGFNGFYANDESIVVTSVDNIVDESVKYFEYLKNSLVGKNIEYDLVDNKLKIQNIDFGSTLIVYKEASYPSRTGSVCYKIVLIDSKSIEIPEECMTFNDRAFILNYENKLLGSFYIK